MDKSMSAQAITDLAKLTRLKEDEGLLLALYPDFILAVRPGMTKSERNTVSTAARCCSGYHRFSLGAN